jgi:hypothetical protein
MTTIYGAYDKTSETYGLGWADQWDYKFNDKYGSEEDSQATASTGNNQKLAKVKAAASTGMGKTKSVVTSGAQKLKSGTSTGFKWIKEKVQKKPQ